MAHVSMTVNGKVRRGDVDPRLLLVHFLREQLRLTGVLLCMYDANTRLASEVSEDIDAYFKRERTPECIWSDARAFTTRIRRNIRLAEAPSYGQSILQYAPGSNGAEDYRQVAHEVLAATVAADSGAQKKAA